MILNTGGRTDTVQYYSKWLLNRFQEGYVLSRNPMFPDIVNRIELDPETIDVMVYHHRKISRELFEKYWKRFSPYGSVASLYLWAVAGGRIPGMKDCATKKKE